LKVSSIPLGLCVTIAVISAAIADPVVEFASNAGCFGGGNFTDHSNLDIIPSLLAGIALLALYMTRKAQAVLAGRAIPRNAATMLPWIFALQMVTLYGIETAEQFVAWGHSLGPMIWLGAPLPFSLAIHAAVCLGVTYVIVRSGRVLAATTLRVIRMIVAIATLDLRTVAPIVYRRLELEIFRALLPLVCTIGERAPPLAAR
jgi:hypothetical protein